MTQRGVGYGLPDLINIPADARCLIFQKLTNINDITDIIKTHPKFQDEVYRCVRRIKEDSTADFILASTLFKFTKLESADIRVLVSTEDELMRLADTKFRSINVLLSKEFSTGTKGAAYNKFMRYTYRFVERWVGDNIVKTRETSPRSYQDELLLTDYLHSPSTRVEEDETFLEEKLSSPLRQRKLRIERDEDIRVNYSNDVGIRFIYDKGRVHLYNNHVRIVEARRLMFDILSLLNKVYALRGLWIFTDFINRHDISENEAIKYINFFGHELSGLTQIVLSKYSSADAQVWVQMLAINKNITSMGYVTEDIGFMEDIMTTMTMANFVAYCQRGIEATAQADQVTWVTLPLPSSEIPHIILKFPNVRTVGFATTNATLNARIGDINATVERYPNLEFACFLPIAEIGKMPKFPNVKYFVLSNI